MSKKTASLLSRFFSNPDYIDPREVSETEPYGLTDNIEEKTKKRENSMKHHAKKGKLAISRTIKPVTFTQEQVFKAFMGGSNVMMHGIAGTGKSFIGVYLALKECERYQQYYKKVVILRSGVPSRDLGYLPGSIKEKAAAYEAPYEQIVNKLYERGDAYEIAKAHGNIEFVTTSFLRGITFENCIVVVDEIQNMSYAELSTVITRMGDNCRVIFCGDFRQSDLFRNAEKEGLNHFMNIIEKMQEFSFHEFNIADIVRSKMVKSFLVEEAEYRDKNLDFRY